MKDGRSFLAFLFSGGMAPRYGPSPAAFMSSAARSRRSAKTSAGQHRLARIGRNTRAATAAALVLVVIVAAGCVKSTTAVEVHVDQTQIASTPGTSAADVPVECTLRSLDAGAAGDVFTLRQGGAAVSLVVSLRGSAGELPAHCNTAHLPAWTVLSGACSLQGNGYTAGIAANSGAPIGSSCLVQARVEAMTSNILTFSVVAP